MSLVCYREPSPQMHLQRRMTFACRSCWMCIYIYIYNYTPHTYSKPTLYTALNPTPSTTSSLTKL
jgi:hypothetical protein